LGQTIAARPPPPIIKRLRMFLAPLCQDFA
jgi:hypothetical protein